MLFLDILRQRASSDPDKIFVKYDCSEMSYEELFSQISSASEKIRQIGYPRGSVCGLMVSNPLNFLVLFFAVMHAGCVPILFNKKTSLGDNQKIISGSFIKSIITDSIFGMDEGFKTSEGNELKFICPDTEKNSYNAGGLIHETLNDGTLFLLITSGTGGMQKLVKKTENHINYQSEYLFPQIAVTSDGNPLKYYVNVPLWHSYGLEFGILGAIYNDAQLFLSDFNFSEESMRDIESNRITHLFTVPPFISALTGYKKDKAASFDCLDMVISAGMRIAHKTSENFFNTFGFNISSVYGITEVGCVAFKNAPRSDSTMYTDNNVGRPIYGNEITVLDETGKHVDIGKSGRVFLKKAMPDGGYYGQLPAGSVNKFSANNKVFATDDIGYIDESGSLHLLGREAAYINVGGEKINSFDVETSLKELNLFKEVLVFSKKDSLLGEKIAAAVVIDENNDISEDKIRELCKTIMTAIKIPREISILKKPFPKTATGKIRFDEVMREINKLCPGEE